MLFLVSFILTFISSYLFATILTKKAYEHFVYLLLSAFSQIVLIFEILSLFKAITEINIIVLNIVIFLIILTIWLKKGKPIYFLKIKEFLNRFKNSLKLDKVLFIAFLGFLILIVGAIFLNCVIPISNADAEDYHFARSVWYVLQGSFNHFSVADSRAIIFPINSEILYAWILVFIKKDLFQGFYSFFGFILSITSIYKIMKMLGFSMRKILWCIFVLSSFASVLVQLSSTETDILTGSLIITSIALFWISLKEKNKIPLFMASLAYALAIGTKTTAILAIPAISLILTGLSFKYKNYKNLLCFIGFGFFNFIIFGAYNYILNFLHFGNIMGATSAVVVHKNFYGFKGMVANFVRHIFLFFDFSGFKWSEYIGGYILKSKEILLNLLQVDHVSEGIYSNPKGKFGINNTLFEPQMGLGILGFIVYLPCLLFAIIKPIFKRSQKTLSLCILAFSFIIFILTTSYVIAYMNFNIRFLTMFVVITSPILVYSYFKKNNLIKTIFLLFMLYYMILVSTHIWARPIWLIAKTYVYNKETISYTRQRIRCSNFYQKNYVLLSEDCSFWSKMEQNIDLKNKKILYIVSSSSNIMIPGMLNLQKGAHIDLGMVYDYPKLDLKKYDYIVLRENLQYTTLVPPKILTVNYKLNASKLKFQKKADYYCFLKTIEGKIYDNTKFGLKNYPYSAECFFDKDTYIKNKFKYKGSYLDIFGMYEKN